MVIAINKEIGVIFGLLVKVTEKKNTPIKLTFILKIRQD